MKIKILSTYDDGYQCSVADLNKVIYKSESNVPDMADNLYTSNNIDELMTLVDTKVLIVCNNGCVEMYRKRHGKIKRSY